MRMASWEGTSDTASRAISPGEATDGSCSGPVRAPTAAWQPLSPLIPIPPVRFCGITGN